jgi:hypothetical protein
VRLATTLSVSWTTFKLKPAFRHIPVIASWRPGDTLRENMTTGCPFNSSNAMPRRRAKGALVVSQGTTVHD